MKRKKKSHGHYCRICGERKANEKFSGRGHASHICKACHSLPLARRNELENINKIDRIQGNFFLSKENIKRLKKYASDKRYPESSQYAQNALDDFYRRMDEYNGNNVVYNGPTEPVIYSELDATLKTEILSRMEELIAGFIDNMEYIPDEDDMREIFSEISEEFSDEVNYSEPEPFSPADYYGGLDYDFIRQQLEAGATLEEVFADDFADDTEDDFDEGYEEDEEDVETPKKVLTPDETMIAVYNELLDKVINEFREDGFDPPTYLDSLVVAETDRLKIRYLIRDDLPALLSIMKKPEVMYAWEHGFSKSETRKWLNRQLTRYHKDSYGYFAVTLKDSGKLIGQAGLMKTDINGENVVELGYIFDNSVWGHGYCTEAAKACIEMAFDKFGIDKLYCTVRPENEPSIRVAKRLGMVETGEFIKTYDKKEMLHLIYVLNK